MNSLRHGLRALTVGLPGENREEFKQLCDDLEREWEPQSRTAKFYLEQMAVSQWKLTRMEVAEAGIFKETLSAKVQLPLLDRLWQAQCRLERSYARAQRELERLQKSRRSVDPPEVDDSDKPRPRAFMTWIDPSNPSNNRTFGPDDPRIDNNLVVPQEEDRRAE